MTTTTESNHAENDIIQPIVDQSATIEASTPQPTQESETVSSGADSEHHTPRRSSSRLNSKRNASAESPNAKSPMSTPTKKGRKLKLTSDDAEPLVVSQSDETSPAHPETVAEPTLPMSVDSTEQPIVPTDAPALEQETLSAQPAPIEPQDALPLVNQQELAVATTTSPLQESKQADSDEAKEQADSDEAKENGDINVNAHSTDAADTKKHSIAEDATLRVESEATLELKATTTTTVTAAATADTIITAATPTEC